MPDQTAVAIDEIQAHLSGRLLSVSESVHRLLELPLHKEFPAVTRLAVHLPRQHMMVFDPTADEESIMSQAIATTSTLTAWFELNACDAYARQLYYHEVPEHYIWTEEKQWRRRSSGRMNVGRIYNVSHHNAELFALRRLLRVVKGATSFADMSTFDGMLYPTFSAACMARGLFVDDTELVLAFMEVVEVEVSILKLRYLFASMIVNCAPTDAVALFNRFVDDLCQGSSDDADNVNEALLGIEDAMLHLGRSLEDHGFKLPDVLPRKRRQGVPTAHVSNAATRATAAAERDKLLQLFTAEQHAALQTVTDSIGSNASCNVFALLASAGCGKTVFANGLAATVRSRGGIVVSVAASALAAMLLSQGSTAHSAFHIPIPANDCTMCGLSICERRWLREAQLIVYDECSMVHQHVVDTVDRSLRDVCSDNRPFGGKIVLFTGDFKQLLPVVRHGRGCDFTIQRCSWWRQVQKLNFTVNWRAVRFPEYSAFLEQVGNGELDIVTVPAERIVASYDAMIDAVYGTSFDVKNQILALTLETCAAVNKLCISRLPGEVVACPAVDSYVDCQSPDHFPSDYVESLHFNGAPPFMLDIKIGAKYMLIRNLDQQRGLINGTMLEIVQYGSRHLQCRVLTGKSAGSIEFLLKNAFTITPEASGLPFTVLRRQYPLIPAYCLSVHKAQGQTISKCGLIFESDPFTHGQVSRCTLHHCINHNCCSCTLLSAEYPAGIACTLCCMMENVIFAT
jgi:hypothetical protein